MSLTVVMYLQRCRSTGIVRPAPCTRLQAAKASAAAVMSKAA